MTARSSASGGYRKSLRTAMAKPVRPGYLSMDIVARIGGLKRVREAIESYSRRRGVPPDAVYRMKLAVEEACSNVIRHAYRRNGKPRKIHLEFEWTVDQIVAGVRDSGRVFNIVKFPARTAARIAMRTRARGGYGIHLIKSIVDEYSYVRSPDGKNELRLVTYF